MEHSMDQMKPVNCIFREISKSFYFYMHISVVHNEYVHCVELLLVYNAFNFFCIPSFPPP